MPVSTSVKPRRGANPVQNVATGGIAQRINGALATERVRTTGRPVVLPREPLQNDIVSTEGFPSLKPSVRVATQQKLAARPKQQVAPRRQTVLFAVQKQTKYGQTVRLVGESSELGCWSMDNGIELLWGEGHEWHAHVQLPPGTHIFKFVLVDNEGRVEWESTANREIEIRPTTASTQYCTLWNRAEADTSSAPLRHRLAPQLALSSAPKLRLSAAGSTPSSPVATRRGAGSRSSAAGASGRHEAGSAAAVAAAAAAVAAGLARTAGSTSTSGRANAAAVPVASSGVEAVPSTGAPARLDIFALCGVKGKLWKVDLGGMDDVWGMFGPSSSSSSGGGEQAPQADAPATTTAAAVAEVAPMGDVAAMDARRRRSSSLGAGAGATTGSSTGASTSTSSSAAVKAPSRLPAASVPQPRPFATKVAATAVAVPAVPIPSPSQPAAAPAHTATALGPSGSSTQQAVADARHKLQQLLGGSTPAAAAAAAAVASRRAVAAEEASLMSALVVPQAAPPRAVARKLRPEERAALMRKAQWSSDDGVLPAGAKPVVLEATVQQKMAMLFTGLITGEMPSVPLW